MKSNGIRYSVALLAAIGLSAATLSAPALAASSGGSSGGSDEVECRAGLKYDKQKQMCVPDGEARAPTPYETGRDLAAAGEYERALDILQSLDQGDAMVLTMIGYSMRKMGNVEEGIAHYHRALAIEPDNVLTREYLGEGYVSMGRIDLAQAELDQIGLICGTDCEQYHDLAAAIAGDPDW